VCGENPTVKELIDYEEFCGLRPQAAQPQTTEGERMEEITAAELKERIERGDDLQIIDVREPNEFEVARIPGATLIPLGQVTQRMGEIEEGRETVVHCKGGVRSARAIEALRGAGFKGKLVNLKGGITAWSNDVDPSVPKY
jgi:adenylyltransferase/sulfurtransferase